MHLKDDMVDYFVFFISYSFFLIIFKSNSILIDFIPIYFIKLNLKIIQNQMTSLIDSNHRNDGTI